MVFCVIAYLGVLLAPTVHTWGRWGRATLDRPQGWILFACYAVVAAVYLFWFIFIERSA